MKWEQFLRAVDHPYWVDNPLQWEDREAGCGIAFFAREGRAGLFNLSLLMLHVPSPPPAVVYRTTDLAWVIQNASIHMLGPRKYCDRDSLEFAAATLTLPDFCRRLQGLRVTKTSPMLTHLLTHGLHRITHDIRPGRAAR